MYGAVALPITSSYSSFSISTTITCELREDGVMLAAGSALPGLPCPHPPPRPPAGGGAAGRLVLARCDRHLAADPTMEPVRLRLYHHPDGTRVAYRELGTGRPLALLHSGLLSHKEWEPAVSSLADRFRVVLPDLPLHGDSEDHPRHPYTLDWFAEGLGGLVRGPPRPPCPARLLRRGARRLLARGARPAAADRRARRRRRDPAARRA